MVRHYNAPLPALAMPLEFEAQNGRNPPPLCPYTSSTGLTESNGAALGNSGRSDLGVDACRRGRRSDWPSEHNRRRYSRNPRHPHSAVGDGCAPESSQLCRGEDSLQYRCGAKAANDLDAFIDRRPVSCVPISLDQYRRTVATVSVDRPSTSANGWSQGLASTGRKYSKGKFDSVQRKPSTRDEDLGRQLCRT